MTDYMCEQTTVAAAMAAVAAVAAEEAVVVMARSTLDSVLATVFEYERQYPFMELHCPTRP